MPVGSIAAARRRTSGSVSLYTYWRIVCTSNTGGNTYSCADFITFNDVGGTNLVLNIGSNPSIGTAFGSSLFTGAYANAFDGNISNIATLNGIGSDRGGSDCNIGVQFVSGKDIRSIQFTNQQDGGGTANAFKNGRVEVSNDGSTWLTATTFSNLSYPATQTITISPITPVFSVAPSVTTDTGFFGTGDVATVTYTHNGTSTAIQWLRDGTAISGATSASYTYVSGDAGHTVVARVTATNWAGSTSATSSGNSIVTPTYTPGKILFSGDMQSGVDALLASGDMQSGTDYILFAERTA